MPLFTHFVFISQGDFDGKWLAEETQGKLTGKIDRK